jgi:predicted nucleic acid-binding protein
MTGLELATHYHLGGRDALILANFLIGGIRVFVTFDRDLLRIKRIRYGRRTISLKLP